MSGKYWIGLFLNFFSMKILFFALFAFLQDDAVSFKKYHTNDSGKYEVKYTIQGKNNGIPQVHSPAQHIRAIITVSKITGTDTAMIGKHFRGIYTATGCHDDNVGNWVARAISEN
jgi:hypothetical protein